MSKSWLNIPDYIKKSKELEDKARLLEPLINNIRKLGVNETARQTKKSSHTINRLLKGDMTVTFKTLLEIKETVDRQLKSEGETK